MSAGGYVLREACVGSLDDALTAEAAGADRIELCRELVVAGLTPDQETIRLAAEKLRIPFMVLVRPRSGDFFYTESELAGMLETIRRCKLLGSPILQGFAVGVLLPDGKIDVVAMEALVHAAAPLEITFHMAFDATADPFGSLEVLVRLGVKRILSRGVPWGQPGSALDGRFLLKALADRAAGRIVIMPGGGLTNADYLELVRFAGVTEVHGTRVV